ncbi:MAG: Kelch repeat type 1-containing protein [Fibrobacteres bacterium]|nr:Kelch repeat type 1-containing protein [Fibrobacterota bacterium]
MRTGFLGLLLLGPVCAQTIAAKWMSRAALPTSRGETGAARLGDKIYVACGFFNGLNPSKEAYAYTPGANTWQAIAPVPVSLHHTGMASAGGKLYVMGGVTYGSGGGPNLNTGAEWSGSTSAFEYDPATDKWRAIKPLPHSTAAAGVVSLGEKIYVIGGVDGTGVALDLVQEYNPATDTWATRTAMPTKREHVGAAVLDSLIYVSSGRLATTSMGKLEAYSPASDKWYSFKDMLTVRSDIGFAQSRGKFYAMGGEKPGIFDVNEEYDPATNAWKTVLKMTATRKAMSVVNFQDTIFVFGGFSANGLINTVEAFVPPGGTTSRLVIGKRTEGIRLQSGGHVLSAPFIDVTGRLGHFAPGNRKAARNSIKFIR